MMRKIYTVALITLSAFKVSAQTTNAAPYCTPSFGTVTPNNAISQVSWPTPNITGSTSSHYTFYNNLGPFQYAVGSTSGVNVVLIGSGAGGNTSANTMNVFVDFNHDNIFESYEGAGQTLPGSTNASIFAYGRIVPDTALEGVTRMRLQWTNNSGDPCQSQSGINYNGEVEDYQIIITGTKPVPRATIATNLGGHTATLQGTVNVNGSTAAAVDFEYGPTTTYTNSITGGSIAPGTTGTNTPVSANITGLSPNTIYHYRVKAVNGNGTNYSEDRTFVTNSGAGINSVNTQFITVSPNPTTGLLQISGLNQNHKYTATLYDVVGKKVFEHAILDNELLHLETYQKGTYFVRISVSDSKENAFYSKIMIL